MVAVHQRAWLRMYKEDALREQHFKCCYCRDPLTFKASTTEHKQPKSKGGGHSKQNIAASCARCNRAKGDIQDAKFQKIIKHPEGDPFDIWMVYVRRKLNLQIERSLRNIKRSVGGDV